MKRPKLIFFMVIILIIALMLLILKFSKFNSKEIYNFDSLKSFHTEEVYNYKEFEIEFEKPLNNEEIDKQGIAVFDSKNEKVNATITRTDNNVIIVNPPEGGYKVGETYILKVDSVLSFSIDKIKNIKVQKFSIKNMEDGQQIVKFADKNLEKAVRSAINKPNGEIKESDVEKLTSLVATSANISNLSGIENLINLHTLCLDVNQINDISFIKDLTDLQVLGLSHNKIQDVSKLKNLTSLRRLSLYGNPVKDISSLGDLSKRLEWKDF